MSNQTNDNKQSKSKAQSNNQGSEYHREHAGKVEGYGEPYPDANSLNNMTDTKDQ
ncbi:MULTISPECIES: hypothetical protein [Metabacillus]|uniref:DUF4025 domain-containing protein n=1 Tax=Metabacillus rhizosphaerae TaxID=3117747 RepID=A0ABZ2MPN9_9BACI|nr:hypothetical protein [Metabacillus litoralis]